MPEPEAPPKPAPEAAKKLSVVEKTKAAVAGRDVTNASAEPKASSMLQPLEAAMVTAAAILVALVALVIVRRRQNSGGH